jgi:hypothetical protein
VDDFRTIQWAEQSLAGAINATGEITFAAFFTDGSNGLFVAAPEPVAGACCVAGACSIQTEADCIAGGGEYGGDWVGCAEVICNTCVGDLNNDGAVDVFDYGIFAAAFGSSVGDPNYNADADFDSNGVVDVLDYSVLLSQFGRNDCFQLAFAP